MIVNYKILSLNALLFIVFSSIFSSPVWSQAEYRYSKIHEDSVRILVIWNHTAVGHSYCPEGTKATGLDNKDFVTRSLLGVTNIKVVKTLETQWSDVQSVWAPLLPHVIVHVQAGHSGAPNGPYISSILNNAADSGIGVVSVGDDAAHLAQDVFGFTNVDNGPLPMGDAHQYDQPDDQLWIDLHSTGDVPQEPGIITNALNHLLDNPRLDFKPFAPDGRCHADADKYSVLPGYLHQLSFMGYQRAYDASASTYIGGETELSVIAAFGNEKRRGVSLSFQPHNIQNTSATEQIVYDAIMWASFAHEGFKVDAPVADPATKEFAFIERVVLSSTTANATIYYRTNALDSFIVYNGTLIEITENTELQAYAEKVGYVGSDTTIENYTKTSYTSAIQITKYLGESLGGLSILTEKDDKFIVKLTTPYATLTSVSLDVTTTTGKDRETIIISNPKNTGRFLEFIDTLDFAISGPGPGNDTVEAFSYDTVNIVWDNPINTEDKPTGAFFVKPSPNPGKVYFADVNGDSITNLIGNETTLYVVVEDQIFDPTRLSEYRVTLTNSKGENNTNLPDKEVFQLTEFSPGIYGVSIPVSLLTGPSPVAHSNGSFEIRKGDDLKVVYIDPLDKLEASDSKGFGVPNQLLGRITFTNDDFITPASLTDAGKWDASISHVNLSYQDDYVAAITHKLVAVTLTSINGQGVNIMDTEIVNMSFSGYRDSIGEWVVQLPLDDNPWPVSGDGKLQFYFTGEVKVEVATHKSGTVEKLAGDTARAVINVAYDNQKEEITIKEAKTGAEINRNTSSVQICIVDQTFSNSIVDTLLLDKVTCKSSGDKLEDVILIQTAANSTKYCGTVKKEESVSGVLTDDILHCQDIDNLSATYTDPVYGTKINGQVTIMDATSTTIQFVDILGTPITGHYDEVTGNQIIVRLIHKTPKLNVKDTLLVKFKTDSGDTLDVLVYETSNDNGIFEAMVNIGFSETPNKRDNILEGTLFSDASNNQMILTGFMGSVSTSINVNAAYVPVDRAWIVDGNGDGHADSIYIRFKEPLSELPSPITSIDWPYEGASGYTAFYDPVMQDFDLNLLAGDPQTIAILLPGSLDEKLNIFLAGETSIDPSNPPSLTLPVGKLFQNQEVLIEDGIGAVIVDATKHPSDNTYYKDSNGDLQKQPDTLVITLSEKIRASHNNGTPWDSLFLFISPNMEKSEAYPLISFPGSEPVVKSPDSLIWTFVISNNANIIKPLVDDEIFMNSGSPYVDAAPNANKPEELEMQIRGIENLNPINHTTVFVPVVGVSLNNPSSLSANLHIDQNGNVTPGRDVILVLNQEGTYEYQRMWIKPAGLQEDGSVSAPGIECELMVDEGSSLSQYPENCLSTVQVFSTDAYIAEIAIFDHLGKFVHQSTQYFGSCKELDNHYRRTPRGLQSWLVWNQKDTQGTLVGTGVYIWKVKFTTSAGQHTSVYRQGVVRAYENPKASCAQ
ncbi:MAG: chitobiase/beta-hexosaminidase C-terminal domain-containing protein [Fibrobacteria bacterium]|nr:chitobiase/beta-hexosaminidase C-terminal domain-containing protein [Fibrobacteria bacterium]